VTTPYVLHRELPVLNRPVLVVSFGGWIDAGGAAATAMSTIESECDMTPLATFDSDVFIDYRARRPIMELRDGVNTRLVWHDIVLKSGTDANGLHVLTLTGPEPDSQWHLFASVVAGLAVQLRTYQMVGLGAYPFAIPHTRQSRLSCTSPSADVIADLRWEKGSVDLPAGMSAVLEHALTEAGVPSLGIWVRVPHYVSAMSYPAASVALLQGLREVTGVTIGVGDLAQQAEEHELRIDQLVAGNEEHAAMVRQLEAMYDAAAQQGAPDDGQAIGPGSLLGTNEIPSGDELAAEFERFLRDQGD
jgi:hypothetical protein